MTDAASFHADCLELAERKLREGKIDRRTLLKAGLALGIAPSLAVGGRSAFAQQAKELVMVNWGGIANEAYTRFYAAPFEKKNPGIRIVQDSAGASAGKIRAMVESKKVTWDLCDSAAGTSVELGKRGLLEPIDYTIVDKAKVPPKGFAYPYGVAPYSFSSVIVYDAEKFKDDPPKSFADFWDLKKYPGKRLLRKDVQGPLEAAVMAAGVPLDKVYPLDEKLAFKQIEKIKDQCIYWSSAAESEQIMRQGEAVMGLIWHTRAKVLFEETKGRLDFTWNQGILSAGIWVVPKGNPAGKLAMQLLASMQEPEPQVELLKFLGNGPTNPAATALVPPEYRRFNPMDPENLKLQAITDGEYLGNNQARLLQDYLDIIAS